MSENTTIMDGFYIQPVGFDPDDAWYLAYLDARHDRM